MSRDYHWSVHHWLLTPVPGPAFIAIIPRIKMCILNSLYFRCANMQTNSRRTVTRELYLGKGGVN